ncbi:MAG: glycosyltransferase family 4 protein [Kiritimatiellia bacterium]
MRIVQILPSLNDGGVERGTVESNREYVKRGHESWVISAGGRWAETIERDGGHVLTLDVKSKNPLTALPRIFALRRALRSIRPEIIHYRSRVPGWLTHFANRGAGLGVPMVSTMHGLNHICRYSRIMVEADRVICVSTQGQRYIQEHYAVDPLCLRVIPRGIDSDCFDPARVDRAWCEAFKQQYGLNGRWIATVVGRVSALKGYQILLRAVAKLQMEWPELSVLIVGGPQQGQTSYFDSLKRLTRELGIETRVVFAGSQSNVRELYALSNVVCSCNIAKPESFGRTVAEAMAMNVPVIAAAHGGVLDIVQDKRTGWLVPPGDVDALANALLIARQTSLSGLREHIVANFSLNRMVTDTLALYQELLHRSCEVALRHGSEVKDGTL